MLSALERQSCWQEELSDIGGQNTGESCRCIYGLVELIVWYSYADFVGLSREKDYQT